MKAKTDHAEFTFTVKEYEDGAPWIICEPLSSGLPALGDSFLGLRLRDEVTAKKAEEVAQLLRLHVRGISHTQFL